MSPALDLVSNLSRSAAAAHRPQFRPARPPHARNAVAARAAAVLEGQSPAIMSGRGRGHTRLGHTQQRKNRDQPTTKESHAKKNSVHLYLNSTHSKFLFLVTRSPPLQ